MLSLPPVIPRDGHNLWYTPRHIQTNAPPTDALYPEAHLANVSLAIPEYTSRRVPESTSTRSALALLAADEANIKQRKQNIRRFGAGWLRPPGILKTYQATMDEVIERREQELAAQRAAYREELIIAQNAEEAGQLQADDGGDEDTTEQDETQGGDGDTIAEPNLDDDVPFGDEMSYTDEDSYDDEHDPLGSDEEDELAGTDGEDEDELADRTGLMMDETDIPDVEGNENENVNERNLDDDIPDGHSFGSAQGPSDEEGFDDEDDEDENMGDSDSDAEIDDFPDVLPAPPSSAMMGAVYHTLSDPSIPVPHSPFVGSPRTAFAPPSDPSVPFHIPRFPFLHPSASGPISRIRVGGGGGSRSTGNNGPLSGTPSPAVPTPSQTPARPSFARSFGVAETPSHATSIDARLGAGMGMDGHPSYNDSPAPGQPTGRMMGMSSISSLGTGLPYGRGFDHRSDLAAAAAAASSVAAGVAPESVYTRRRQAFSAAAGIAAASTTFARTSHHLPLSSPGIATGTDGHFTPGFTPSASISSAAGGPPMSAGGIVFGDDLDSSGLIAGPVDTDGHSSFWSGGHGGSGGGAEPESSTRPRQQQQQDRPRDRDHGDEPAISNRSGFLDRLRRG